MSVLDRFSTTVFFDPESSGYIAVCDEIPGVSAFGVTRADALREFETVLEMAVDAYRAEGWPLPLPHRPIDPALPSGEFRVRLPRYVHALLARRAEAEGVSQNTLVVALLAQGLAADVPLGDHDETRSRRGARVIASEAVRDEPVASSRTRR
jgi:predicted RNase H-like HicB family nuclease